MDNVAAATGYEQHDITVITCRQIDQMVLTPQPSLPTSSSVPLFEGMDCVSTGEHAAMLLPATELPLLVPLHVGVKTSGRILHNSGNTSPSSGKFVGDPRLSVPS